MKLTQEEWRKGRIALVSEMDAIMQLADEEERALNDNEQARFDHCAKEIQETDDKMKRHAVLERVSGPLDIPRPTLARPGGTEPVEPDTRLTIPAQARRHGRLRAFKGPDAAERAYECGKWILGGYFRDTDIGEASRRWCRQRGMEWRVMTEGSGPAGGYLVPESMESAIINLKETRGVARQECQVVPMPTETVLHPRRTGGVTINAIGETSSITAADATVDQVTLVAKKWGGLTRFSTDLNEDSLIAFTDFLAEEFAYGFADKEDEALFNGDGTNTYHGIFGIAPKGIVAAHAGTLYDLAATTTFAGITLAQFEGAAGKLPQYAAMNAKWFITRTGFYKSMQNLMNAAGGNTIDTLAVNAAVNSGTQLPIQFMGYPVVITQVMSSTESTDEVPFVIGDMRQTAMLGDRRGITLKIDGSRYLEYDQMAIQATTRWDIVAAEMGDTTTAGSMIVAQFST